MEEQLDKVEQAILTDIFGGYSKEHLAIKYGIFKFDISDKVQRVINDFEDKVKPFLDSQGNIQPELVKRYLPFINIKDEPIELMELYQTLKPLLAGLKDYLGGIK